MPQPSDGNYYTPGLPTLYGGGSQVPQGYKFGQFSSQMNRPTLPNLGGGGASGGANYYTPNPLGAGGNNPNEPAPMANQYNQAAMDAARPPGQGGGGKPKTWRDVGHEQIDSKLGPGWAENFQKGHGISPLDFYSDKRNWFSYQRDAAMDYGTDSKEFAQATIRAAIDEGMKHSQEVAMWQQLHGSTPIPDEMWVNWFYVNRGMSDGPVVW